MNRNPWRMDDDEDEPETPAKPGAEEKTPLEKEMHDSFFKNRRIFMWGPVDDKSARDIVTRILFLDSQSSDDIVLLINSPGGVISSGMAIVDAMHSARSKIATVVMGQAASMGAVLLAAGAKGKRYAWSHSRVMIHQPLIHGHMYAPASDIEIQATEMLRIRQELNEILAAATGKSVDQIEKDTDRDYFMTAPEAKAYGLVDHAENFR